jgi:non-ribosomal peptide synthetase component F
MRLHIIATFAALLAWPAAAQEEPIQQTITAQIEAFRAEDFERAYAFASPTIHQIFGPTENFASMVVTGYPMVVNPARVEMQDLRTVAGALWQRVRITDQKGQAYLLDYQMVEGPDGWLINAVQMQRAADVGA